jgi:hypothetical protein
LRLRTRLVLIVAIPFALLMGVWAYASNRVVSPMPPIRRLGPSRPNTDPPAPAPSTQDGISVGIDGITYGSETDVSLGIRNDTGSTFTLTRATAVSSGREYSRLAGPSSVDGYQLSDRVPPHASRVALLVFPYLGTTRSVRYLVHGVVGGRRLDWEIDAPGVTR